MVTIRRLQIGESELFKQIRLTALCESPSAFASSYETALKRSSESWREQADGSAQGPDRSTFIAFSGDSPVGMAALYRDQQQMNAGELLQVWVSPEFRSKGVAKEMLAAVVQWARENGFRTIVASVAKRNERALRFYLRCGFIVANGVLLQDADDIDDTVLVKQLTEIESTSRPGVKT
jgi:RimJ/RimL family protein N-acetyltransferase